MTASQKGVAIRLTLVRDSIESALPDLKYRPSPRFPMPEPTPLADLIRHEIRSNGPVHFSWYMQQALYHPAHGYYTSTRHRIGRKGDYCTNVSVGRLYGQLLASQLAEMWVHLGRPPRFIVVEEGAEDGQLAIDILSALRSESPKAAAAIQYAIVEPLVQKQRQQRTRLEPLFPGRVAWLPAIDALDPVTGAFISNELVDAMPVDIIEYRNGSWSELLVTHSRNEFLFEPVAITQQELTEALQNIPLPLSSPYRTEINLAATHWIERISAKLARGFILVVDYGYPRREYYKPERTEGTLSCYSRHRRSDNPFERPGEIDITSHVDFTTLADSAVRAGLAIAGYTDQHHFMVGAAEAHLLALEKSAEQEGARAARTAFLRPYLTLMHPGNMGLAFKYLLLTKGLSSEPRLTGFKYAGDPWRSLR
jgi:SAM-dependent MidA family methyltransferase